MSDQNAATASGESLSPRNFSRLAQLIQGYSGIKMPASKRSMLEGRLRRRMRANGAQTLDDYCHGLFDGGGIEAEMVHLIDVVTTNKTDFFREPAHFDFLRTTLLPALAEAGRREIKAWSAAASTGAEAYTLAMVLDAFCEERHGLGYSILATDICTDVLKQAQAARYAAAMVEPVPMELRRRYFLMARDDSRRDVRIVPRLRSKVAFAWLNLMDERYAVPADFDLLFCRNVLIYFDKPTQARVLARLCDHLRPGGHLFLGHSESIVGLDLPVTTVANTIFRRM